MRSIFVNPVDGSITRSGFVILNEDGMEAELADFWGSACTGFSRTMASAFLSILKPRNTACRIWPPPVHSPKDTSATRAGFAQWAILSIVPLLTNGQLSTEIFSNFDFRSQSALSLKPVPTFPAY